AAFSAVVADAAMVVVFDHDLAAVHIGDARDIDVVHLAVVVEAVALPIAAVVAGADVAEAVVDAAVITHLAAPVAWMPPVGIAGVSPVARCPERADEGRQYPRARHPVIALVIHRPVSGGPDVARARNHGLAVGGKWRRRLVPGVHADADGYVGQRGTGRGRDGQQRARGQQRGGQSLECVHVVLPTGRSISVMAR